MREDLGTMLPTLDFLGLLSLFFLTLGICTALSLVFSFGLCRATLVFYSMLISPNCCVMTHSGIVFQVWRQVEC